MNKKHALIFVTITVFLDTVGFGIIVPVLPQYLTEVANASLSEASALSGYLVVSYAITNFLFSPLLGGLSDSLGRRPILVVSLFFYSISYLLAGFATALWVLFLGRLLTGITSATYATANALIADVSPAEERAQNFGLMGLAFGLGFIFGPALGGIIGAWDVRAPFFCAAGLAFINCSYGFFFLKETLSRENRRPFEWRRANPWGAIKQVGRYPLLIGLLGAVFLYNIGHHVYPSNWNFYTIEKFSWTPWDVGLSMAFVGVLSAIVQGGLIRIAIPKLGAVNCVYIGVFSAVIAYIGIGVSTTDAEIYFWIFVSALAGLGGPAITSILSNQVEQNAQGELQGILASIASLATIAGPLILTQTFTYFTSDQAPVYLPGSAFFVAAAITLIALLIFVVKIRKLPKESLTAKKV
jgi:DHA1 family tetracycline resistance protein-like MFS transporter|tara:strand:+ start:3227 stop:4459 length:1233 start_codon:yes stop_codon:yes gene_type:complete